MNAFTANEIALLQFMADGLVNKEIAANRGLSTHTIKNQITRIFQKLEVCTRTQAVVAAIDRGLILNRISTGECVCQCPHCKERFVLDLEPRFVRVAKIEPLPKLAHAG